MRITLVFLIIYYATSSRLTLAQLSNARVHFQWNYVNYTWPSNEAYDLAIQNSSYIPENNVISGVKVWKNKVYLTVPRLKKGVPSTLNVVSLETSETSPLLQPYPSWSMQREDDCDSFQLVESMEIDPLGRMWVINNGRIELRTDEPKSVCPSRLMIFDLENNGKVLLNYVFPDDVVQSESVFLNDIVVDHENGGYAYISDNDSKHPGIVVFSLRRRRSWKISHKTMEAQDEATKMTVNGTTFNNKSPVNGIGLSQASLARTKHRLVYYSPIASFELFAVPTWVLKRGVKNIDRFVIRLGRKSSQSAGMIVSAKGVLYFSLLGEDAVCAWDTSKPPFGENHRILIQDHELSQYADSFAIDEDGRLWYTSNRLQVYRTDSVDTSETNIRLIVGDVGVKNYQYLENGSAPKLPKIRGQRTLTL